jgi:hypothetical protein
MLPAAVRTSGLALEAERRQGLQNTGSSGAARVR